MFSIIWVVCNFRRRNRISGEEPIDIQKDSWNYQTNPPQAEKQKQEVETKTIGGHQDRVETTSSIRKRS